MPVNLRKPTHGPYSDQLVVRALAAFQNLTAESLVTPFTYGFGFIRSLLSTHPVYPWVKQAVKAGFLPLLMHCSMRREDLVKPRLLVEVINLLASSCIYPSVLPRLGTSMTGLHEIMAGPQFHNCPVRAQWLKFKAILFGQLSTLNKLEATAPVTERACDNLDPASACIIARIHAKDTIGLAAAIEVNAESCETFALNPPVFLIARQKRFILALVSEGYQQHRDAILATQTPGRSLIQFKYLGLDNEVGIVSDPKGREISALPGLQQLLLRASRKDGLMVPTVVALKSGLPHTLASLIIQTRSAPNSDKVVHSFLF
ncbi:hypothetical protein R3P38DRAFT_3505114 [Favolaschia claudopus]|uniref:Uncharacterized protein n=1 Tax=Favolaschia claudopus TaxID=2862362 RepID=A0AAV9Z285_9AGAR